jgi:putative colanic acid biosynthesis acetyltransferase WcaF
MTDPILRRLDLFQGRGYIKGRPKLVQCLWWAISKMIVESWWIPSAGRIAILRMFGASIGTGVIVRSHVRVHWPWKLVIGDHCWLGEGAWILNLEPVVLADHVCVSQEALLCAGSHDPKSPTFEFKNAPIHIDSGVWICARAIVLPGSSIQKGTIIPAGSTYRQRANSL